MKSFIAIFVVLVALVGHTSQYDTPDAQTLVTCKVQIKELGITQIDVVKDSSDAQIQYVLLAKRSNWTSDKLIPAEQMTIQNIYIDSAGNRHFFLINKSGQWAVQYRDESTVGWLTCD